VDAAELIVPVVADIVQRDDWPVRPSADNWPMELELSNDRGHVVCPEPRVVVAVARSIRPAVSAHVHRDEAIIVGEVRVELPTPAQRAL
jgi:hypothetical protein